MGTFSDLESQTDNLLGAWELKKVNKKELELQEKTFCLRKSHKSLQNERYNTVLSHNNLLKIEIGKNAT